MRNACEAIMTENLKQYNTHESYPLIMSVTQSHIVRLELFLLRAEYGHYAKKITFSQVHEILMQCISLNRDSFESYLANE